MSRAVEILDNVELRQEVLAAREKIRLAKEAKKLPKKSRVPSGPEPVSEVKPKTKRNRPPMTADQKKAFRERMVKAQAAKKLANR